MSRFKDIFLLLALVFVSSSYAGHEVKEIHAPGDLGPNFSVYLDNGEILEVEPANDDLVETLNKAMLTKSKIEISKISNNFDEPDILGHAEIISSPSFEDTSDKQMYSRDGFEAMGFRTKDPLENSFISILPSYDHAQKVMDNMNGKTHDDSQCYNRAHMWTYEALAQNRVNLGKIWIYFSKKYIREFRHKWWFHVSPYTLANNANEKYVLDRGFTTIPYTVENWKNIFIKNKAQCAEVKSYSMYENSNGSGREYCYFIFSSQYYWQPYQLKNLSEGKDQTWGYRSHQMKIAFKDALRGNWDRNIPIMPESPVRNGTDHTVPQEPPREVDYYRGFSKKSKVLYKNNMFGKIEELYSNGSALIDLKGRGEVMARVEDLAKEVDYYQGWNQDDDVWAQGRKGDIDHLFDNGMAVIDFNWSSREAVVHVSTLTKR